VSKVYFPMDHTPDEWREMSRECYRREQESFDRCDTDGFLSQWASSMTARLYSLAADVAEQGGMWPFRTLADADGKPIDGAREVRTRYGWAWVLPDGTWFNPSKARSDERADANNRAKGFTFVHVDRPAVVALSDGGGTGLSGAASCYPVVLPKREREDA
jgi:hypothetical protein